MIGVPTTMFFWVGDGDSMPQTTNPENENEGGAFTIMINLIDQLVSLFPLKSQPVINFQPTF